jgi:uncharacterized protein (DUF433 family)
VEAHVLAATHDESVPLKNVRTALDFVGNHLPFSKHPLVTYEFATKGKHVFVEHLGKSLDATAYGQEIFEHLEKLLRKITKRGPDGYPLELEPHNTTLIVINPNICSGRPVLKGSGVPIAVLWQRKEAQQPISKIAKDFGLHENDVARAIEEFAAA